jgi:hypothetical protein
MYRFSLVVVWRDESVVSAYLSPMALWWYAYFASIFCCAVPCVCARACVRACARVCNLLATEKSYTVLVMCHGWFQLAPPYNTTWKYFILSSFYILIFIYRKKTPFFKNYLLRLYCFIKINFPHLNRIMLIFCVYFCYYGSIYVSVCFYNEG